MILQTRLKHDAEVSYLSLHISFRLIRENTTLLGKAHSLSKKELGFILKRR